MVSCYEHRFYQIYSIIKKIKVAGILMLERSWDVPIHLKLPNNTCICMCTVGLVKVIMLLLLSSHQLSN